MSAMRSMLVVAASVLVMGVSGCQTPGVRTLLYINSYHPGYASSDEVMAGIYEVVGASNARLDVFFMDTERFPEPESIAAKVDEAMEIIGRTRPDVIIASDDNAVKYIVAEHFKSGPIPCVFCGVNWTCEPYGLPTENVTGMLEVLPVHQTVRTLQPYYPNMKRMTVLSGNTASERQNKDILGPIFAELGLSTTYALVDTYDEWKMHFLKANAEAGVIFLTTNGAIANWDPADAQAFVRERIRVPVFTCDDFMMEYAVFGLTTVTREQGQWAARAALRILRGKSLAAIPVTQNQQTEAYLNTTLAAKIGFEPDRELLASCKKVQ